MAMRVLINVNEQISATMLANHFKASSLEAEVTEAPNNMMAEIAKACKTLCCRSSPPKQVRDAVAPINMDRLCRGPAESGI